MVPLNKLNFIKLNPLRLAKQRKMKLIKHIVCVCMLTTYQKHGEVVSFWMIYLFSSPLTFTCVHTPSTAHRIIT